MGRFTSGEINNIILLSFLFTAYAIINLAAISSYYRLNGATCPKYTELNLLCLILLPATICIFTVKYTILTYDLVEPFILRQYSNLIKVLEYKPFK